VQAPPAPGTLPAPPAPAPDGGPVPSGGGGCATPDEALDRFWAPRGPGWTGGDGGWSVPLPDGRVLWLFGDSFLGRVGAFGQRERDAGTARNAILVQEGDALRPLHLGTALTPGAHPDAWYWPLDATVEGDQVRLFVARMIRGLPGADPAFDFRVAGTDVVSLDLERLQVTDTRTVVADFGMSWGNAVLEDGEHTYVFGVEEAGLADAVHVARVPAGGVLGPWEHWDGTGWSADPMRSARVFEGVPTQFGVVRQDDRLLLVAQTPLHRDVFVAAAAAPQGPWSPPATVYTTPEWGTGSFSYNATPHPQLGRDGDLVVGYSVNTRDPVALATRPGAYRLRFVRVPAGCLPAG
jgi:hypothetical protein